MIVVRDQHVERSCQKSTITSLELVLVHLAVADDDAGLRHELAQLRCDTVSIARTRLCTKNDLAAALQLAQDRAREICARRRRRRRSDRAAGRPAASAIVLTCRGRRSAPCAACAGSAWPSASARRRSCRSCLSCSLCSTPKRCSSSMITRPRSLNRRLAADSSRCVPITMSTAPSARPAEHGAWASASVRKRRQHLDRDREVGQALAEGAGSAAAPARSSAPAPRPACRP